MSNVRPVQIYLSSRVAEDAHQVNNRVAAFLRRAGFSVFVPHEAAHNRAPGATEEEIYRADMSEMLQADVCVVVGRIGVDCAFEVGWLQNHGVPMVWAFPPKDVYHPMLSLVPKVNSLTAVGKFIATFEASRGNHE